MKYFLPEYVDSNPYLSQEERDKRDLQWEIACEKYEEYMQNNKDIFSSSFLNVFHNGGFHDYNIKKINFDFVDSGRKTVLNIIISLEHHGEMYFLINKEVTNFSSSIDFEENNPFFNDYLYGEYYKDDSGLWHHNFLFGLYYEINITSKKFIFKKHTYY